MGRHLRVLCVDDGSTDATPVLLQRLRREWPQVRVVRLRANAGHQAAISAGLVRARGHWVVTIDADLQDPPEVIGEMLAVARGHGVDVVYGVRNDRSSDTGSSASPPGRSTLDRRDVQTSTPASTPATSGSCRAPPSTRSTALPEHNRVLRLIVPALSFPSATVGYPRAAARPGTRSTR